VEIQPWKKHAGNHFSEEECRKNKRCDKHLREDNIEIKVIKFGSAK